MNESAWLSSSDLTEMFSFLRGKVSDRKLRLFAVACCRAVWAGTPCKQCRGEGKVWDDDSRLSIFDNYRMDCPACRGSGRVGGLTDPRSRRAVEVAEKYADGLATKDDLSVADIEADGADMANGGPYAQPFWAAECCTMDGPDAATALVESEINPPAVQASLLRDIFNPFRPVHVRGSGPAAGLCFEADGAPYGIGQPHQCIQFDDGWLAWNDGAIPKMARAIYDERRFDDLPMLADALEDAGCTDAEILMHCRGMERCWLCAATNGSSKDRCSVCCVENGLGKATGWRPSRGPHVRGCWLLDLILGKE